MKNFVKASYCLFLKILLPSLLILGSVFLNIVAIKTVELAELTMLGVLLCFSSIIFEIVFLSSLGSYLMEDSIFNFFQDITVVESKSYLEVKQVSSNTYEVREKKESDGSVFGFLWAVLSVIAAAFSILIFIVGLIAIAIKKGMRDKYANTIKQEIDTFKELKILVIIAAFVFAILAAITVAVQSHYKVNFFNSKKNETMNIKYGSQYITATVSGKTNEASRSDVYGVYYPIVLDITITNACKKDIDSLNYELVIYDKKSKQELFRSEHKCLKRVDSGSSTDDKEYVFCTTTQLQDYELSQLEFKFKIISASFSGYSKNIVYKYSQYIPI